jgi:hypothetical protein
VDMAKIRVKRLKTWAIRTSFLIKFLIFFKLSNERWNFNVKCIFQDFLKLIINKLYIPFCALSLLNGHYNNIGLVRK